MAEIHIFIILSLMFVLRISSKDCKTQSCLTNLYNSKVIFADYYVRPLSGSLISGSLGSSTGGSGSVLGKKRSFDYFPRHAGIVVTLENWERWLIHKGSNYGDASDTVITDADYTSSSWSMIKYSQWLFNCGYTVNTFIQNALILEPYNLIGANCQKAANRMWELVERF
ncbi:uncharacterized protein LOC133197916 [Saccostrea echinata]|uniref:uncharacterized protein LOC133197916 n=1 Tax=Saccostrea echinata TaxID=191078 RepID=UPI002A815FA2|nr:uncharacterized protein LOC133197916 [Saccostrea echinata]